MTGVVASINLCHMVSQTLWRSNARKTVSHQTQGISGSGTFTKVPGTFVEVLGRSAESPRTSVKVPGTFAKVLTEKPRDMAPLTKMVASHVLMIIS